MEQAEPKASDLVMLVERFERWREQRSHQREGIPADLWAEAGRMAERMPLSHVASALRLNPSALKKKMSSKRVSDAADASNFLKTSPQEIQAKVACSRGSDPWRLVLERPDGSQLKLAVPSQEREQVFRLVLQFLG